MLRPSIALVAAALISAATFSSDALLEIGRKPAMLESTAEDADLEAERQEEDGGSSLDYY